MAVAPETDSPRLLPTLPGEAYTSPEIFAREQEVVFARRFILVGRSDEIAEPGTFVTRTIAGESVILVRRHDGVANGFLNVCRHRGSRMLLEERGTCGKVIRCPYHSWSYALDGTLQGAPNIREWALGDERQQLSLQTVAVHEEHGFLWARIDPDGPSFEDDIVRQLERRLGEPQMLEAWHMERLETGHKVVYDVKANWKLIVENFMECYHCTTIHPELVDVIPSFRSGMGSQSFGAGHGSELGPEIEGFTFDGRAGLPAIPTVSADDVRRYYGMTLKPSAFLNLVGDHVIVHRIEAVEAGRSIVSCDWLFEAETLAAGHDIGPTVELFHRVNLQDFEACERCQLGASSRAFAHGGVLVPLEHKLNVFYDEVRDSLA